MKSYTNTLLASIAMILGFGGYIAMATSVPEQLVYEGRIVLKDGTIPTDNYEMRFSFWSNADYTPAAINANGSLNTSLGGYALWTEEHPVVFNELGHFSTILGNNVSLANLDFDQYKFLQVEIKKTSEADTAYTLLDVNGDNGADTIDRKTVASVPYALNAESSNSSNAETFIIDAGDIIETAGTGDISLQFGGNLQQFLNYSFDLQRFVFTDDLQVNGDFFIQSATGSVQISADNITSDIVLTVPDEDTTIVGETNTQTLTNKTIDGANNTLTNISRASLLAFPQKLQIFPQYSDTVFKSIDKTSVYMGKDGENPYYKVTSFESSPQSGTFTVSVGLPEGYEDFTDGKVVLNYKTTTGSTTNNAVSVSIKDLNGAVEATELNAVSGGAWDTIEIPLNTSFSPVNDVLILEIKTSASSSGEVYLGALEVHFQGK